MGGDLELEEATRYSVEMWLRSVMKWALISWILAALLSGCSKESGLDLAGTRGNGDLVPVMFQCATSRGAHSTTNKLPTIQTDWVYQSRPLEDIFLITGDHFAEIQGFLQGIYGEPDTKLGSRVVAPMGSGRSLTYSADQIGVALNLTGDSKQTIICILGARRE